MTRILFVCLGNICRSPMAEFIFWDLAAKAGLAQAFEVASAGTSSEEYGNPVYPPARRKLAEHGIDCAGKTARQLTRVDYRDYDLLIGMETYHLAAMRRICGGDPEGKMHRLLDYTDHPADIADPWYTRDFDTAWAEIEAGCRALLGQLQPKMESSS